MRRSRLLATAVAYSAFAMAASMSGCGGNTEISERPLTADEAATLASVQLSNHQVGGATFELNTTDTRTNDTLSMSGQVDWVKHRGRALVRAQGAEQAVVEVAWDLGAIAERRTDVDALLASMGYRPGTWITRSADPTNRQLDRVVSILAGLSSKERDNAILIQQKEGSEFVRGDTWRNTSVNVLRYGKQILYWLDAVTNELRRFEGNNSTFTLPVVIDFLSRTPQAVPLPAENQTVPLKLVRDAYAAATGG